MGEANTLLRQAAQHMAGSTVAATSEAAPTPFSVYDLSALNHAVMLTIGAGWVDQRDLMWGSVGEDKELALLLHVPEEIEMGGKEGISLKYAERLERMYEDLGIKNLHEYRRMELPANKGRVGWRMRLSDFVKACTDMEDARYKLAREANSDAMRTMTERPDLVHLQGLLKDASTLALRGQTIEPRALEHLKWRYVGGDAAPRMELDAPGLNEGQRISIETRLGGYIKPAQKLARRGDKTVLYLDRRQPEIMGSALIHDMGMVQSILIGDLEYDVAQERKQMAEAKGTGFIQGVKQALRFNKVRLCLFSCAQFGRIKASHLKARTRVSTA